MHLQYMLLQSSLYDKCAVCAHFTHILQGHDLHWIKDYSIYWIYTATTQSFLSNYISYFQYYVFKCVTIWFIHNAYNILKFQTFCLGMWEHSWLGQCTSNWNVKGSIPDGVIWIFKWNNAFGRTMALGLTEPLTGMSKGKAILTGLAWPRGFQEVKVPRLHDNIPGLW